MLGLANYELSLKRLHAMKFEVSPDPMVALALCAAKVKVMEFLFAKVLPKQHLKVNPWQL